MREVEQLLDEAELPDGGGTLRLYQRGNEFAITVDGWGLMDSELHGSEVALAELACQRIAERAHPRVLIGGLGMGFTTAAALRHLGPESEVVVSELVPAVLTWNDGPLGERAGRPMSDSRVAIHEGDVAELLQQTSESYLPPQLFDAILLDVDNGPRGLTCIDNAWLYSSKGVSAAFQTLVPGGILAVWSASPNRAFSRKLRRVGFEVEEVRARARGVRGGARHMIWLATRPSR